MKKVTVLLLLYLILSELTNSTFAQQYVAKCDISTTYWSDGICNSSRSFKDLMIFSPILYINETNFVCYGQNLLWMKAGDYRRSETVYVIVNNYNNLALVFNTDDYEFISGKALNFYVYGAKSYGTITYSDNKWVGLCNYKGSISFTLTTFDVPNILNVEYLSCSSEICTGSNICIKNNADQLRFHLSATNPGDAEIWILAYDVKNNKLIDSVNVGTYSSYKDVRFDALNLHNYYGTVIKFIAKSSMGGQSAYSYNYSPIYTFFKQLPAAGTITTSRKACAPYIYINVPLDNSVINNVSEFKFIAIYGNCESTPCNDSLSNIIQLKYYNTSGNVVTLVPFSNDMKFFNRTGYYTLQIFQSNQETKDKTLSLNNVSCAVKKKFYIALGPELPNINLQPVLIDNTVYSVTRYDRADGQVKLKISNITKTQNRIWAYYGKAEPNPPDAWTGATQNTVKTYQSVELDGISGATTNSRKSEWTLGNFQGNARYFFYLKDVDGCETDKQAVNLYKPDPVTIVKVDNTKVVTCHSNNADATSSLVKDGEIAVQYSGGIPPYNIIFNSDTLLKGLTVTSATYGKLAAGSYKVRVVDKYQVYKDSQPITVASNPEMTLTALPSPLKCYNDKTGSVRLSVNNNLSNVTYKLTGQSDIQNTSKTDTVFRWLNAGTYSAEVINLAGCKASVKTITVTQPQDISIAALGSKIARYGDSTGTINATINGGTGAYSYYLFKNTTLLKTGTTARSAIFTGLADGYYSLKVDDANSCHKETTGIRVQQPDAPLKLTFTQKDVDCYGNSTGEVYPLATGGWKPYQFGINGTLNGSVSKITGLKATLSAPDTVFVIDSAGIAEKLPVTIKQPSKLIASAQQVYNLKCFEDLSGAVKLNISGGTPGYSISTDKKIWVPGDSISGLPAASNKVIYVKDNNNCPSNVSVTITQPEKLITSVDSVISSLCNENNGAVYITVSGGSPSYQYLWYYLDSIKTIPVNSNKLTNLYSGQYRIKVTDSHLCKDSLLVSVSDVNGPAITEYSIDSVSCFGGNDGKITISGVSGGTPGYQYFIDGRPANQLMQGLSSKTYHVRITDQTGCKYDQYFAVYQPVDIRINGIITPPVCSNSNDGYITARVTGGNAGYVYSWSTDDTTQNLQKAGKGIYTLTVTDRKGCSKSESFEIISPPAPTANLNKNPNILCEGNELNLDGGNFLSYQWYRDNQPVSAGRYLTVSQSGTYVLKITDNNGCEGTDTFRLEVSEHPLNAHLLLPDSALVNESINVIDVTWPVPDSIQWFFDRPVLLLEANAWSQHFTSEQAGNINVTLRAWYGGCYSDSTKNVVIILNQEPSLKNTEGNQPLILGFTAYPNPNNGLFTAKVKLSRKADITVTLYNGTSGSVIEKNTFSGMDTYELPYSLNSLIPGVYVLELHAEPEKQMLKIIKY
jgi:hypothetical protein